MADVEVQPISDFDLNDEEEARLDAEAEADYAAGRVTSHERMCEWLNPYVSCGPMLTRVECTTPKTTLSNSTHVPLSRLPRLCATQAIVCC
jgi:hypothetical protein